MYIEENNKIKIHKSFDVAVCGGGFAGISAAIAAARNGAKTVLFEKHAYVFERSNVGVGYDDLSSVLLNQGLGRGGFL